MAGVRENPQLPFSSEWHDSEDFPIDIEDEVFSILAEDSPVRAIADVDDLLFMLKRFKKSPVKRDQQIFACMVKEMAESWLGLRCTCSFPDFEIDIEAKVSSYFENISGGELTIEELLSILKLFRKSSVQRERKIFACMVKCLFDDYKFFPRYLESNLRITAVLVGSLLKYRLLTYSQFKTALCFVLGALEQSDSKIFSLGIIALEQFMDTMVDWTCYCEYLLMAIKLRETHGAKDDVAQMDTHRNIVEFLDGAVAQWGREWGLPEPRPELSSRGLIDWESKRTELTKIAVLELNLIDQGCDQAYSSSSSRRGAVSELSLIDS